MTRIVLGVTVAPARRRSIGAVAATAVCGPVAACGAIHTVFAATTPVPAPPPPTVAAGTPGAVLTATPWETTAARNPHGDPIPLTDDNLKPYLGFVYFEPDGTFTMFGLDDAPKTHGDWWLSPDGKTRTVITKNAAGQELSRTDVDVVTLTDKEFIDRVHPDPLLRRNLYFDIVYTPTDHRKPGT